MRKSIPEHIEIKGFPFIWLKFSILSLITTSEKEKEKERKRERERERERERRREVCRQVTLKETFSQAK